MRISDKEIAPERDQGKVVFEVRGSDAVTIDRNGVVGGGSLPSQWTIDAHGGLTITPDGGTSPALTLVSQGTGASQTGVVLVKNADSTQILFVDSAGLVENSGTATDGGTVVEIAGGSNIFQAYNSAGDAYFGVFGQAIEQPTIAGSRGGNAALASLITALAAYGLIVDSTT